MLIKEQLFKSAIVIFIRYDVTLFRPVMKFDPTLLIRLNFHGPFVTGAPLYGLFQLPSERGP